MRIRVFFLGLISALVPAAGFGKAMYVDDIQPRYEAYYSCGTCHISIKPVALNPYGLDYAANGYSAQLIEPLDSDGDGFSNYEELWAGTWPGKSSSYPGGPGEPVRILWISNYLRLPDMWIKGRLVTKRKSVRAYLHLGELVDPERHVKNDERLVGSELWTKEARSREWVARVLDTLQLDQSTWPEIRISLGDGSEGVIKEDLRYPKVWIKFADGGLYKGKAVKKRSDVPIEE